MHSQHAHVQRMIRLQSRQTEQCAGGRNVCLLQKLEQLTMGISQLNALPHQSQRSLGIVDEFGSSLHGGIVEFGIRLITTHTRHTDGLPYALVHLCILREVEHYRARTTATSDIESTTHRPRYIFRTTNLITPFRDGLSNTYEVNLLKRIGSKSSRAHLSANDHDGRRIHHGISHTRERVGGSRTARNDAHTHLTTDAGKTLGSMCGGLLVAHQDMIELLVFASRIMVERIENRHDGAPRVAEDGLHTLLHQRTHQSLRASYLFLHP